MMKIDFVLPWVDSGDKAWQAERNRYKYGQSVDTKDTHSEARFRDMGTLKYALRSIEQHCPWYHRIYLITTGHCPDWLDIEHEKITLVPHDRLFIDKSHLPVFNSVSIEMNLVNLKTLSENFVYMNDDFIIFNTIEPSRFFMDDKPVDFLSHNPIPRNRLFELLKGRDSWIHSINNVLELINDRFAPLHFDKHQLYHKSYTLTDKINNFLLQHLFKRYIWLNHWHHPQPLLKQTLQDVYDAFSEEMMQSSRNKFRSKSDLNQYMYRYWQLSTGNFYPYRHQDDLIANISSVEVLEEMLTDLEKSQQTNFVCFNDSTDLSESEYLSVKNRLTDFLEKHFPQKASFEK